METSIRSARVASVSSGKDLSMIRYDLDVISNADPIDKRFLNKAISWAEGRQEELEEGVWSLALEDGAIGRCDGGGAGIRRGYIERTRWERKERESRGVEAGEARLLGRKILCVGLCVSVTTHARARACRVR
eukprot:4451833-Pleurochrysis_carterae.AAC.1